MREKKREKEKEKTKKRFIGQEGRRDSAGTHTRISGTSETPERRKYAPRFIRGFSRREFSSEQTITRKFLGRLQSSCVPEIRQSSRLIRVERNSDSARTVKHNDTQDVPRPLRETSGNGDVIGSRRA